MGTSQTHSQSDVNVVETAESPSSYDDGAADGTTGLAGINVQASVQGEAAFSTSVPARSANNGIGFHKVNIAVGA